MTVKEFLKKQMFDIDVFQNVLDEEPVAYCPTTTCTKEGEKEWGDVLRLEVVIEDEGMEWETATVRCNTEEEAERSIAFFLSMAGYCSDKNWDKWFINE